MKVKKMYKNTDCAKFTYIMGSCEIIANYHQLPIIGFHQALLYLSVVKLGYLALVCIHLRVCYRHVATSEKKQLQRRDVEFMISLVSIFTQKILEFYIINYILKYHDWT